MRVSTEVASVDVKTGKTKTIFRTTKRHFPFIAVLTGAIIFLVLLSWWLIDFFIPSMTRSLSGVGMLLGAALMFLGLLEGDADDGLDDLFADEDPPIAARADEKGSDEDEHRTE